MALANVPRYFQRSEDIDFRVVGAGGNGSHFLRALSAYDYALKSLEHPHANVKVWDDDDIEEHNIGRQSFGKASVGFNKATTICSKINLAYGFEYKAVPERFVLDSMWPVDRYTIFVLAVDSLEFRLSFYEYIKDFTNIYIAVLDMGNSNDFGQVNFLPNVEWMKYDYFQDYLKALKNAPVEKEVISCSHRDSIRKQGLFVNNDVALAAVNLLWKAKTSTNDNEMPVQVFIDHASGKSTTVTVPCKQMFIRTFKI